MVTNKVVYDLQDDRWLQNAHQLEPVQHRVVLTFDDGPSRQLIPILNILKEKKVPAVFFWQSRLFYHDRPWQRLYQEGHMLGSHAHKHLNLTKLTAEQQHNQIKMSIESFEKITGRKVTFFRPPFGQYNEDTVAVLEKLNLIPVMWEISSYDWNYKNMPEKIVDNVVRHVKDGSIILLHELSQTVSILPQLIDEIRLKGYEFMLLKEKVDGR